MERLTCDEALRLANEMPRRELEHGGPDAEIVCSSCGVEWDRCSCDRDDAVEALAEWIAGLLRSERPEPSLARMDDETRFYKIKTVAKKMAPDWLRATAAALLRAADQAERKDPTRADP